MTNILYALLIILGLIINHLYFQQDIITILLTILAIAIGIKIGKNHRKEI